MGTTAVLESLEPLVAVLRADGYRVIGPTVRGDAIVLDELESADALPYGRGVRTGPGHYRLTRRPDAAAFGHAAGPQSWKSYLHPPREPLFSARRGRDGDLTITEPDDDPPCYAFLGVRGCDLRAIAVLDRVLSSPGGRYARRRERVFVVAVNCTEPSATCFCASAGTGPAVGEGFDLALTELIGPDGPRYLVEVGTPAGDDVLTRLPHEAAGADLVATARSAVADAAARMSRALPEGDLRDLLAGSRRSARWDEVASRCLTCGNCTMVCPTCFCTTVVDTTDLTGEVAERSQRWDSCFDLDYSYLAGGPVRGSARGRYRQWLSHKLGAWHDQFGESGCVGCGRCIAWCPAGIDITAEANALAFDRTAERTREAS